MTLAGIGESKAEAIIAYRGGERRIFFVGGYQEYFWNQG